MQADIHILAEPEVMRVRDVGAARLAALLQRFAMQVIEVADGAVIPGSYWGECEAGLRGNQVFVRADTPLHSALHEACHWICMDQARRAVLDTDAGGDYDEENAVCYLQILLADQLTGFGHERMLSDMDAWGYTFRLGSARSWFELESADARQWLVQQQLLDGAGYLRWCIRQ